MKIIYLSCLILLLNVMQGCRNKTPDNKKDISSILRVNSVFKCQMPVINVGAVVEDTVIQTKFFLINKGHEKLTILEYHVSCNCTSASISKSIVYPADTTCFSMSIKTAGKSPGKHQTDAIIKTNGQRTFYRLTTKYEIKKWNNVSNEKKE